LLLSLNIEIQIFQVEVFLAAGTLLFRDSWRQAHEGIPFEAVSVMPPFVS